MTEHFISSDVSKARIAKWIAQAQNWDENPTWIERRLVIEFQGHIYPVVNGQIFQCAHCGHYDPQWSAQEVIKFFQENFGAKSYEIEVTCTLTMATEED